MFEKLWEIVREKEDLLDQSKKESLSMLGACGEMFGIARKAIKDEVDGNIRETIREMDRKINKQQQGVRKMVFEHLAVSSSADLLTGLQLLNIVIDIERVGDYAKNIADVADMIPGRVDFGEYGEAFESFEKDTAFNFNETMTALETGDEKRAEGVIVKYDELGHTCDKLLKAIITEKTNDDMVEKRFLAIILLLRYIKRVNAHLKNISTTIVNPFHRIGYRPR